MSSAPWDCCITSSCIFIDPSHRYHQLITVELSVKCRLSAILELMVTPNGGQRRYVICLPSVQIPVMVVLKLKLRQYISSDIHQLQLIKLPSETSDFMGINYASHFRLHLTSPPKSVDSTNHRQLAAYARYIMT